MADVVLCPLVECTAYIGGPACVVCPHYTPPLGSIVDEFVCVDDCPVCHGAGIVCENHPAQVWDPDETGVGCGCGAGMPCLGVAGVHG